MEVGFCEGEHFSLTNFQHLPYTDFWEWFAGGGGNPACYKNSKISGAVPEGAVTMQAAASLFGFVASAPLG